MFGKNDKIRGLEIDLKSKTHQLSFKNEIISSNRDEINKLKRKLKHFENKEKLRTPLNEYHIVFKNSEHMKIKAHYYEPACTIGEYSQESYEFYVYEENEDTEICERLVASVEDVSSISEKRVDNANMRPV